MNDILHFQTKNALMKRKLLVTVLKGQIYFTGYLTCYFYKPYYSISPITYGNPMNKMRFQKYYLRSALTHWTRIQSNLIARI